MIQVEMAKWQQTVEDLLLASLNETHPRSRERFQALYLIRGLGKAQPRKAHEGLRVSSLGGGAKPRTLAAEG